MLESKWNNEPTYIELLSLIKNNSLYENLGITNENYTRFHECFVAEINENCLDLSGVNLSNNVFGKVWLAAIFMYKSNLKFCSFNGTLFQGSFAKEADFAHSYFEKAQAIPFYAPRANFENCIFESFLTFGFGATNDKYADWNDFRHCNFSNAQISNSTFEYSYFSGSSFSSAVLEETTFKIIKFENTLLKNTVFRNCKFLSSHPDVQRSDFLITDFRGTQFENTVFENCVFDRIFFDDDPKVREMLNQGNNLNLDSIIWCKQE